MDKIDFDMIIVGAGISGIGAAWHLRDKCPGKRFTILEKRSRIGGTWDLFQYPGIRSDSDMHTLGYKFKPWTAKKSIADGKAIRDYLDETVDENNFLPHIQFGHTVIGADWSTEDACWIVQIETDDSHKTLRCNMLFMCSGYYDYETGYQPEFLGENDFEGDIIHPQHWPDNYDYSGKRVIIIGSGATAVTLVPAMAKTAHHVTMVQRSPTYMVAQPDEDWLSKILRAIFPDQWAYNIVRWRNVWRQDLLYNTAQKRPDFVKKKLLRRARKALGKDYDIDTHLTPDYGPWDQRLCLIPNGDLFASLKSGEADIATGHIERFTQKGVQLQSGQHINADIIVTATGLNLQFLGGATLSVDGDKKDPADSFSYEAMMYSDIPNLATVFGYVNYSWTLRADLIAEFMCRLINHMDKTGMRQVTPRAPHGMQRRDWIDFGSGYFARAMHQLPKQGDRDPWLNHQDYLRDKKHLPTKDLEDLEFSNPITAPITVTITAKTTQTAK